MSSLIHYKFKSAKDYDTYRFDGAGVPVWELKAEIVNAKKLGKSNDFDLIISNAQTNEDYTSDSVIVPRNTSVLVRRVPVTGKSGKPPYSGVGRIAAPATFRKPMPYYQNPNNNQNPNNTLIPQTAKPATEEDGKIQAMFVEGSQAWDSNQQRIHETQAAAGPPIRMFRPAFGKAPGSAPAAIPPPNYVCFRCGQKGHFINHCPTNSDSSFDRPKVKKSTGIPKSFLKPTTLDAAAAAGSGSVLITEDGKFVLAVSDEREWSKIVASKTAAAANTNISIPADQVPESLACAHCRGILREAIQTPCCLQRYCEECMAGLLE